MTPLLVIIILVVGGLVGLVVQTASSRRRLAARLRAEWGRAPATFHPLDERAAEAWRELGAGKGGDAALDDRTWADLDLDRVVATIDRTESGLGRQILYRRLRAGMAWGDTPTLAELSNRFAEDSALRDSIGLHLAAAGRSLGYGFWIITRPELIRTRWWYWSFPLLAGGMLVSLAAIPFEPRAAIVALLLVVGNMAARMATAWQIPGVLAPMRQMEPVILTAERLADALGDRAEADFPVSDHVRRLRPLRRIARWVSRDPRAGGELMATVWEYFNLLFVLDANALLFSARHLRELGPVLARVAGWVGDVDLARSVASLRAEPRPWCRPRWVDRPRTAAEGVWHPLVTEPVANDAELRAGGGIIITGANMSGKSTYLRTIGVAAVLARTLETCPARSWEGRSFRVRSLIGRNDDLAAGKSYYQVEADGVVALLHAAASDRPTLFLLDELLRGTNTVERLAAGEAVLRSLLAGHAGHSPHVVVVATHDGELVQLLEGLYQPFHFRETIAAGGLTFDYLRREGPASTRTAIALLEATGAPREVIDAARARAAALDGGDPPTLRASEPGS
ncbi:MAG: hypothetical protein SFV24_17650 [Gemmatimonadales bacterium]|nr:hypothetical protein [Gemmatimonadales bacterium]